MKKFTFLLTLLALVLGNVQSAFADDAKWTDKYIKTVSEATTSLGDLTTGYYLLECVGHNSFARMNDDGKIWLEPVANPDGIDNIRSYFVNTEDKLNYVFYLTKSTENGTYTIQAKSGNYFPKSLPHGGEVSVNATAGNYTIEAISEGQFGLKSESASGNNGILYVDGNGDGGYTSGWLTGWNTSLPSAGTNGAYKLFKVELDAKITANCKYNVNGHVVLAQGKKVVPGVIFTPDNYPLLTVNSYNPTSITESGDVTVNCSMTLPIEGSTVSSPKYYAVNMHTGSRKWTAAEDGSAITCPETSTSLAELPATQQWAFIGDDLFTSFKIYNKATGKYLKSTGSNAATLTESEDDATPFHVMATRIQSMTSGFCISRGDTYLNFQDNSIKTWGDNDQGSTCTIFAPESFPLNYAKNLQSVPEGAIGGPLYLENAENLANFKSAYNAANADPSDANVQALVTINKAIESSGVGTQFSEGYYRLVNRKDGNNLHINGNILNDQAGKTKAVGSVVYFKSTGEEGKYNMLVEGKYLGTVTRSANVQLGDESNKGIYVVASSNYITTIHEVSSTDDTNYHYLHVNGGNAVGWEAGAEASQWYAIPATDIEVALTAVDDQKYASVYLPFAVSKVVGADVYTGALNDAKDELNMTKVEGGIPANIGVVLVGSADKAILIIGESAATIGTNSLVGTNTGVTFADATPRANYLVFGTNSGNVGFYTPSASVTAIPANKAYLDASAISAVKMSFGGATTGLNNAVEDVDVATAPIFDLSGRRVVKAVKGGVYIQNGKKFVK